MSSITKKESGSSSLADSIRTNCGILGIAASSEALERLAIYTTELIRWNRRINLTGASDSASFANGPLFDAMTLIPVMARTDSFVDIGSGGGLPGIPALILTDHPHVTLVEPRTKRASFLRHIIHMLSVHADVVTSRIESLPKARWHSAASQAVFEPAEWIRRAIEIVAPSGAIYTLTAKPVPEAAQDGVTQEAVIEQVNPMTGSSRYAYRFRR